MVLIDREAPLRFLRTEYEPADWVAVFLKTYRTGETTQRVVSVSEATSPRFQSWLRQRNANSWNVYVSVNAVRPGRSRSRDAICGIRHVFLEEDADGPGLLASLTTRPDLPPPSYVLHSSPGRDSCLLAGARIRRRHRGNDAEAIGKRAAQRHGRDIVRADDQASWFRELQAVDALHRSRSNTCVRVRCLEPTIFLGLDRSFQTTTRATQFQAL